MTYALPFSIALGSGNAGLTLEAVIYNTSGVQQGAAVTTGFVEAGVGNYFWYYASFADAQVGYVVFRISPAGAVKAIAAFGPEDAPLQQQVPGSYGSGTVGASLGLISGAQIVVASPVATSGDISIIRGDDYSATDSRALEWTNADGDWPDLTGATVSFGVGDPGAAILAAGSVVTPTGAGQKVRVELTATQTTVSPGRYRYDVQATLSPSGRVVTLASGICKVTQDVAR